MFALCNPNIAGLLQGEHPEIFAWIGAVIWYKNTTATTDSLRISANNSLKHPSPQSRQRSKWQQAISFLCKEWVHWRSIPSRRLWQSTKTGRRWADGAGAQTVGRKTSWAKDVWANYFLGDRRLGDKLGRYGDSKLDCWATLFRRLGKMCERGETQN